MSHERVDTEETFNCDGPGCNKNYGGTASFQEVWIEARDAGWVSARGPGGVYEHYCPKCKKDIGD